VRQEPALNPSLGTGDVAPGTLLHSGEYTHAATDLGVRGRGLDVAFTRVYRSQTVGAGPLGPGWELGYRVRLRELPNGDVEYYDGTGRRETFSAESTAEGDYRSPAGVFAELSRTPAGWSLIDAGHNLQRFDSAGRRIAVADAVKDSADTGNEIAFEYDLPGRLVAVIDDLGRTYELTYAAAGRLASITDFTGRTVTYGYDTEGRLETVTSPAVTVGESTFPDGLTTAYEYESPAGDLAARLNTRDNLASLTDPRGVTWLELAYTDADGDGRADEVMGQTLGGSPLSIGYDFGARTTTVTDRRGFAATYAHTVAGQVAHLTDRIGSAWLWVYDAEGLVTSEALPQGRATDLTYDTAGDRRSRGNLLSVMVTPDARGANGSSATLTTSISYHARTNSPISISDPRAAVTAIERAHSGLPIRVTRAQGQPEQSATEIVYNASGQPTRLINPKGHVTEYLYASTGPDAGYLEREIADPAGLGLTTRYETDDLGRATAAIDPRGVRHAAVYNELGWMVEYTAAATPAQDGSEAPALGYRTVYRHDEIGNPIEEHRPYGATGDEHTATFREYGALGEVVRAEREITPGGERAVWLYSFDSARHLVEVTDPKGHVEEIDYDERGLPFETRRGLGTGALAEPITERTVFDENRQLASVTDPRGYVWQTLHDGYGRVAAQFDPLGNARVRRYDAAGDLESIEAWDSSGTVLMRAEMDHDRLGRLALQREKLWQVGSADPTLPADVASALDVETRFTYDAASNLERIVDPLGRETLFERDAAERLVARLDAIGNRLEWTLDRAGNPVVERSVETLPAGGSPVTVPTTRAFDGLGRQVAEVDAHGNRTTFHYDAPGNLLRAIDPAGFFTENAYDGLDRRTSSVRPAGISETFLYDKASRLVAYRDALGHETAYTWDAADRLTGITYPDATSVSYELDPAGNVARWTDPLGSVVQQNFDAAGRLRVRAVTPGVGVVGVTLEGYDYDSLSRLTRVVSGAIVTDLAYDSLGRVLADTTAGKTVRTRHDAAGNDTRLIYPSGLELARGFDELDRLEAVGTPATPGSILDLSYRGPGRRAGISFGNGLSGTWSYDPSGRTLAERVVTGLGDPVMSETLSWTPRGLKGAVGRGDLNGDGSILGYDGAGQVLSADRARVTPGTVPNNTTPPATLPADGYRFGYDEAQNLVERTTVQSRVPEHALLPPDASGRNRPASILTIETTLLTWDAGGRLTQKGDLTFEYDYRGRLVRVRRLGAEIALYEYDAFNRKIYRTVEGVERQTVWSGMRPLEEYSAGQISSRRVYGTGLDEIVRMEMDLDGDGALDQSYVPLYDHAGNLAVLTGPLGLPVERYRYAPYGPETIEVDEVAPQVTQARVLGGEILIEWSEGLTEETLGEGLAEGAIEITVDGLPLTPGGGLLRWAPGGESQPIPGTAAALGATGPHVSSTPASTSAASSTGDFTAMLPVLEGVLAGRRLVITLAEPPAAGSAVTVTVHPGAVADAFLNRPSTPWTQSFTWPSGEAVLTDTEPPRVQRVAVVDGQLEVLLSEPPNPATVEAAILVDGQLVSWTPSADGYGLVADTPLSAGTHQLDIGTGIADLAGNPLAAPVAMPLDLSVSLSLLAYEALNPRLTNTSAVGNNFGFHGLELDRATGLIYARNRWYDPEMGRFITSDPLGYVDGPNLYQYGLNDPINQSDPLGLCIGAACADLQAAWLPIRVHEREAEKQRRLEEEGRRRTEREAAIAARVEDIRKQVDPKGTEPEHFRLALSVYFQESGEAKSQDQLTALMTHYAGGLAGSCWSPASRLNCVLAKHAPEWELFEFMYLEGLGFAFGGFSSTEMAAARGLRYLDDLDNVPVPGGTTPRPITDPSRLLGRARENLLQQAQDPRLRDAINQLYRPNARVGTGSSMDAFRFEQSTGQLLSRTGHGQKLLDRRAQLQRLLDDTSLSASDKQLVKDVLIDIQGALSGN
jgi:RHS repeat-associated protein